MGGALNMKPGDYIRVVRMTGRLDFRGMTGRVVNDDAETLDKMSRLFGTPVLRVALDETGSEHYLEARALAPDTLTAARKRRR